VIRARKHVRKIDKNPKTKKNINNELFFFRLFVVVIISLRVVVCEKNKGRRDEEKF